MTMCILRCVVQVFSAASLAHAAYNVFMYSMSQWSFLSLDDLQIYPQLQQMDQDKVANLYSELRKESLVSSEQPEKLYLCVASLCLVVSQSLVFGKLFRSEYNHHGWSLSSGCVDWRTKRVAGVVVCWVFVFSFVFAGMHCLSRPLEVYQSQCVTSSPSFELRRRTLACICGSTCTMTMWIWPFVSCWRASLTRKSLLSCEIWRR